MNNSPNLGETICANASTLPSPIAVIRISGSESLQVLQTVFLQDHPFMPLSIQTVQTRLCGVEDTVMVWGAKGPKTMTGEDYAEIMVHGSVEIVKQVLQKLFQEGIRMAQPGEFSYRAYINGKTSLMEALSVASVISSQSVYDLERIKSLKNNTVDTLLREAKQTAIDIYNALQVLLDYSEQGYALHEIEEKIHQGCKTFEFILSQLESYLTPLITYTRQQSVVITGSPNVGKSTLFNKLVGFSRSISSHRPGTTRDYVDLEMVVEGRKVKIVDTAGIRTTSDEVESLGICEAKSQLEQASAVVWVVSLENFSSTQDDLILETIDPMKPMLIVGSKRDLCSPSDIQNFNTWIVNMGKRRSNAAVCTTTLLDEKNQDVNVSVAGLCRALPDSVSPQCLLPEDVRIVCSEVIERGKACLNHFRSDEYDVGHLCLERLLPNLCILTGEIPESEIYQHLFSSFCLGK